MMTLFHEWCYTCNEGAERDCYFNGHTVAYGNDVPNDAPPMPKNEPLMGIDRRTQAQREFDEANAAAKEGAKVADDAKGGTIGGTRIKVTKREWDGALHDVSEHGLWCYDCKDKPSRKCFKDKGAYKRFEKESATESNFSASPTASLQYSKYTMKTCVHQLEQPTYRSRDGIVLFGARGDELDGDECDLVIDLAGMYKPSNEKFGSNSFIRKEDKVWEELAALVTPPDPAPVVRLHWADRGIPPVGIAFWRMLWTKIREGGYKRVVGCCAGGHGRTGTFLAAMIVADSKLGPSAAIDAVRERHCAEAIETKGQERYIYALSKERARMKGE